MRLIVSQYLTGESLLAFLTLTALEIVLGIDNIIFIAIQAGNLPHDQRDRGRRLGLLFAVVTRVLLLLGIGLVMKLQTPLITLLGHPISGKDLVLILGGLFLIRQATLEIHAKVEGRHHDHSRKAGPASMNAMLFQIAVMDMVFSLDSVITAVGMSKQIPIMIAAVLAAVGVMLLYSGLVVEFVDRNPTVKLLALSFLLMIGVLLVAEGFHQEIDKGYVYFAMAFSLAIELLQMWTVHNERRQKHQQANHNSGTNPAL
jgi:predicted tellurium resistance membrane protein TerC